MLSPTCSSDYDAEHDALGNPQYRSSTSTHMLEVGNEHSHMFAAHVKAAKAGYDE